MSQRIASKDVATDTAIDGGFGQNCANAAVTSLKLGNRQRVAVILTNPSDTDMWIGLGKDPVATAGSETGLYLKAAGGSLTLDNWIGDIRVAHAGAAPKRITGAEI